MRRQPARSTLTDTPFPDTTLYRSVKRDSGEAANQLHRGAELHHALQTHAETEAAGQEGADHVADHDGSEAETVDIGREAKQPDEHEGGAGDEGEDAGIGEIGRAHV